MCLFFVVVVVLKFFLRHHCGSSFSKVHLLGVKMINVCAFLILFLFSLIYILQCAVVFLYSCRDGYYFSLFFIRNLYVSVVVGAATAVTVVNVYMCLCFFFVAFILRYFLYGVTSLSVCNFSAQIITK